MSKRDLTLIMITILLVAGMVIMLFTDRNSAVLERTLDYDLPVSSEIVEMKKHGSLFSRSSYEAKITLSIDAPEQLQSTIIKTYGVDGTYISQDEFETMKNDIFEGMTIIPSPQIHTTMWLQNVKTKDGHKITHIMCAEDDSHAYLYIYYNR
ncbi:MAG: hypothetical protein IKN14_01530 [Clostridiales bacterium]|nr:hypothetical protein [Clostridiales bacterium]